MQNSTTITIIDNKSFNTRNGFNRISLSCQVIHNIEISTPTDELITVIILLQLKI